MTINLTTNVVWYLSFIEWEIEGAGVYFASWGDGMLRLLNNLYCINLIFVCVLNNKQNIKKNNLKRKFFQNLFNYKNQTEIRNRVGWREQNKNKKILTEHIFWGWSNPVSYTVSLKQIRHLLGANRLWTSISQDEIINDNLVAALQTKCPTNTLCICTLSHKEFMQQNIGCKSRKEERKLNAKSKWGIVYL